MQLISGFVDVYLRLNAQENQAFQVTADKMGLLQEEKYMEIVTSWELEGCQGNRFNCGTNAGVISTVTKGK